ncbi:hypothetical protein IV203_034859 [Nitzschia inconspicua]|uniref:Uncharacterized protein n=1 Tax=Nitzschia inconspicua TaxID=303405 RepID=A0A9K3LF51_9STRA|nr:hypothetical protein IV203_034859 [Nitzschia inconspicua]
MIVPPPSFVDCAHDATQDVEDDPKFVTQPRIRSAMKGSRRRSRKDETEQDVCVRFEQHVDVQEVPHLRDIPAEEVSATWYNSEDFNVIKKSLVVTLRLMLANKPVGSDQCTRGLEFRTPHGAKYRKKNKLEALTAVWNEQVAQWKDNVTDDEAIRRVYLEQSEKCRETARKFGLHDERAVQKYLGEDNLSDSDDSVRSTSLRSRLVVDEDIEDFSNKIIEGFVKQSCVSSAA